MKNIVLLVLVSFFINGCQTTSNRSIANNSDRGFFSKLLGVFSSSSDETDIYYKDDKGYCSLEFEKDYMDMFIIKHPDCNLEKSQNKVEPYKCWNCGWSENSLYNSGCIEDLPEISKRDIQISAQEFLEKWGTNFNCILPLPGKEFTGTKLLELQDTLNNSLQTN